MNTSLSAQRKTVNILITLGVLAALCQNGFAEKLLVFHAEKAGWFSHKSIKSGIKMVKEFGKANNFDVDVSDDPKVFTDENLRQYSAVLFLNTSGDFFDQKQKSAFQKFIRSGKGFAGTHCADNTLNKWDWYHKMLGSTYLGDWSPKPATVIIVDKNHPSTRGLPASWVVNEQLRRNDWMFDQNSRDFHVIVRADPKHYTGKRKIKTNFIPYVYTHDFEGGRVWYGGMGHYDATFMKNKGMRQLILWGIEYALGRFEKTPKPVRMKSYPREGRK